MPSSALLSSDVSSYPMKSIFPAMSTCVNSNLVFTHRQSSRLSASVFQGTVYTQIFRSRERSVEVHFCSRFRTCDPNAYIAVAIGWSLQASSTVDSGREGGGWYIEGLTFPSCYCLRCLTMDRLRISRKPRVVYHFQAQRFERFSGHLRFSSTYMAGLRLAGSL